MWLQTCADDGAAADRQEGSTQELCDSWAWDNRPVIVENNRALKPRVGNPLVGTSALNLPTVYVTQDDHDDAEAPPTWLSSDLATQSFEI